MQIDSLIHMEQSAFLFGGYRGLFYKNTKIIGHINTGCILCNKWDIKD